VDFNGDDYVTAEADAQFSGRDLRVILPALESWLLGPEGQLQTRHPMPSLELRSTRRRSRSQGDPHLQGRDRRHDRPNATGSRPPDPPIHHARCPLAPKRELSGKGTCVATGSGPTADINPIWILKSRASGR
jgi:hypothetical protein